MICIMAMYAWVGGPENFTGQAWCAAAQLRSEEMDPILVSEEQLTDREVRDRMRDEGVWKRRTRLLGKNGGEYQIKSYV